MNNHTNMECSEVLEVIRIICFEYLAEIADIGSDLFWLITTAGYIQKENYKGKMAICVVASILWVVNVFRFIHTALGRGMLRAAVRQGRITENVLFTRNVQYAARAYMFEELPNIIMVVYVAEQLRKFGTAALISVAISIVMLLVNLLYTALKSQSPNFQTDDTEDMVCHILICPCVMACPTGDKGETLWYDVESGARRPQPEVNMKHAEKAIEITGSVFI